jgi:hypothetical protein
MKLTRYLMCLSFVWITEAYLLQSLIPCRPFAASFSTHRFSNPREQTSKYFMSQHSELSCRRAALFNIGGMLFAPTVLAESTETETNINLAAGKSSSPPVNQGTYPSEKEIKTVQLAIQAFDRKDLNKAQALFSTSIDRWEALGRPRSFCLLPNSDTAISNTLL